VLAVAGEEALELVAGVEVGDELERVDVVALVARGDEAGDDLVGPVAQQVFAHALPDDRGVERGAQCFAGHGAGGRPAKR
jgi:hypothetical protein